MRSLTALLALLASTLFPGLQCPPQATGHLVTFQVVDDQITLRITNAAFVEEARQHLADGTTRIPHFAQVIKGPGADDDWSWHVDPHQVEWVDVTMELCDGTPSYIEANLDSWIEEVGSWCPWDARVIAVE